MKKARKICCRITPRRIMGAVLIAASILNLMIIGMAVEVSSSTAPPTITMTWTTNPATMTFFAPTATLWIQPRVTLQTVTVTTQTPTFTVTSIPTLTPTDTATATFTEAPSPSPTPCIPQYSWPVYLVQRGDYLSALAIVTGSSVPELMLANCLPDTRIYAGQTLYVPNLPIPSATNTPTVTPFVPTNAPTVFRDPSVCYVTIVGTDSLRYSITISITPYDLEGVSSLIVFYQINAGSGNQLTMTSSGNYYAGSAPLANAPARNDVVYYAFQATDKVGNVFTSNRDSAPLAECIVIN